MVSWPPQPPPEAADLVPPVGPPQPLPDPTDIRPGRSLVQPYLAFCFLPTTAPLRCPSLPHTPLILLWAPPSGLPSSLLASLSALSDRCWQLLFPWVSGPSSLPTSRIYSEFLCLVLVGNGEHPCRFLSSLLLFQSQVSPQGFPFLHSSLCTMAFAAVILLLNAAFGVGR